MDSSSASWNSQDINLSSATQDDFQQFLDISMNGLNFDFSDFSAQNSGHAQQDSSEAMDTGMDGDIGLLGHKSAMLQRRMSPASGHPAVTGTALNHGQSSTESLVDLDAQIQYLQQQRQQQQQRVLREQQQNFYAQNRVIPPTPDSIKMHNANNAQFYAQSDPQRQAIYESFQLRLKEQEMAFTPLVSPAVTPLETHFNIPEYTVPGAYFSPLSSPALHAQNENEQRSAYGSQRSDTSITASPIDMNIESKFAVTSNTNLTKKPAKKTATKPRTPRSTCRSVRQSPIVKPHRRKQGSSTAIPPHALADIVEPGAPEQTQKQSPPLSTASTEGSENEPISPEPLSDMAPPPLPQPGSAGKSPFLMGRSGYKGPSMMVNGSRISPATPASLMRLAKSNQSSPSLNTLGDTDDQTMEGFQLPEAANPMRPQLSRIETQSDGQITPILDVSTVSTPAFQSLPSPAFARPGAAASQPSPQLSSPNSSNAAQKTSQLAARGSKKRSSVSSVHVSPALRPKISPSIKPLIRGGSSVSEDTASLLLASKSNYQNILEGTHLPGVSYPTELSTNLTSKRTSHKIAEQGRRNRINSALHEIATLLPNSCSKDSGNESKSGSGEAGEKDDGGGTSTVAGTKGGCQSANSKASTVELAIEYIKKLKQEVAEANRRAEEAEKKLEMRSS